MIALLKVWGWIKSYWYIPVAFLLFILLWILKIRSTPIAQIKAELQVIKEKATVKKLQVEIGKEKAIHAVKVKYEKELEALEEKQKKQAKELENDPVKLSAFLVRVAGKR